MAKSKKWSQAKKVETFRAKNFRIKSGLFFIFRTRKTITKLEQEFDVALILNHFDPKYYIKTKTNAYDYIIDGILINWF